MTEKLYQSNSYRKEFEAVVLSCEEKENNYQIRLDATAFFPEGGGQSADTGKLDTVSVLDVQEDHDFIYHLTKEPIKVGKKIRGEIAFDERFSKMQQHSGEHIVSGLIHQQFGYDNVGFHLGSDNVTMDFNGVLSQEELCQIEEQANKTVFLNLPIEVSYPSEEELKGLDYRSKIEIQGQTRIVTIPGVDVCACCAPHVRRTGEIGLIKLVDSMKYKGGMRLSMLCGYRALADYNRKEESVKTISNLLSAKPEEVAQSVVRVQAEAAEYKNNMLAWQERYLNQKLKEIKPEEPFHMIFEESMDTNIMRQFVNQSMECAKGISGVFVGTDQKGYHYILGSKEVDVRELSKELNKSFQGKGGGKAQMVQGSLSAAQQEIERKIDETKI